MSDTQSPTMVVTDRFVFIEFPRTGSTHVKLLLRRLFECRSIGMHEPATPEVLASHSAFMGSIRNPWDWYVSLWTFGCGGVGAIYERATRAKSTIQNGPWSGLVFDPAPWRAAYADRDALDINGFRSWLHLLCAPSQSRLAFPQGFGCSDLHRHAGLYTYMFTRLFCTNSQTLHRPGALPDRGSVDSFIRSSCYITHMVHTESLSPDLETALTDMGMDLTESQRRTIHTAPRLNRSHRSLPIAAYYDDACLQLVAERDALLIKRFGYSYSRVVPLDQVR